MIVYRVQDAKGRGPFKPGKSHRWVDDHCEERASRLPTYFEEFGNVTQELGRPGEHYGCGTRTREGIDAWFTATEQQRLKKLGYRIVMLKADRILVESEAQLVFARRKPLHRDCVILPWAEAA